MSKHLAIFLHFIGVTRAVMTIIKHFCLFRTRSKRSVRHKKSYPGTQMSQKLFNGDLLSYIQVNFSDSGSVLHSLKTVQGN